MQKRRNDFMKTDCMLNSCVVHNYNTTLKTLKRNINVSVLNSVVELLCP